MMDFQITTYEEKYKESIGLMIQGVQREFGIEVTLDQQPDLQDIPGFYQAQVGNFWVALADGQVIGTVGLKVLDTKTGALRKMFVHKDYRGKLYGVGQKLLDTLLKWSEEKGLDDVFLGTTAAFLAAHRFYEKNGFTCMDPRDLPTDFPRMDVDVLFFRYRF